MSLDPNEIEDLFQQGLLIPPGPRRDEWLSRVTAGSSELRKRLSRLLAVATPTDDFLERPAMPILHAAHGLALDVLPEQIGRYRILEILGKGGMGVVCRAQQTEPVHRQVALKLIRPGLDSDRIVARFEAERQSLALMDHSNIARVLDAGATVDGRPWFAMELVSGLPITEYCDSRRLNTEERLALLIPVCQAIQHAHQKGIIHRDLKPGNILVADNEGVPVPKVIDFGVAKAVGLAATATPLTTGSGVVVGTMEYMSPEQAGLNQQDVDTRTDVYSLGIVMYELLTGSPPFRRTESPDGNLYDMLRRIREQEPTRPSEKLSTAETLSGLADRRRSEPWRLADTIRGELDWIVLKALEKDREHRYSSVAEFAADIQRFLTGELVAAAPPGTFYRFRKLWKRHRLAMTAGLTVIMSLLIGLIGASWGMMTARAAAEAEKSARIRESEQRRFAEGVSAFLVEDVLALTTREGQVRFDNAVLSRDARLQELLERAAIRLNHRKMDDGIAARLHWIIGVSQRASGNSTSAVPHLKKSVDLWSRALGPDHLETLNARNSLGIALHDSGELRDALRLQEQLVQDTKRVCGDRDLQTLHAMRALAETYVAIDRPQEARSLLEAITAEFHATMKPDDEQVLTAELSLALAIEQCGDAENAISRLQDIVKRADNSLGRDHTLTLSCQEELAMSMYHQGQYAEALELLNQVIPVLIEQVGETHPSASNAISDRAVVLQKTGRLSESLPILRKVVSDRRNSLPQDHPDLLSSELNLAVALTDSGHPQDAVQMLESCLQRLTEKCGSEHPLTLLCLHDLGDAYSCNGDPAAAMKYIEQSIAGRTRRYGPDHPQTLISLSLKGRCLQREGRSEEAIKVLESVFASQSRAQGTGSVDTVVAATNLAAAYRVAGRTSDAIQVAQTAVESGRESLGAEHPVVISALNNLAVAYWREKRLEESIPLFEDVVRQRRSIDPESSDCLLACANLGINYRDAGRTADAVPLLREADRRRYLSPELHWVHNQLRSLCMALGQNELLVEFLLEDVEQYRKEFGPSSAPVVMLVFQGTAELLDAGEVAGAAKILQEGQSLYQQNVLTEEQNHLFKLLSVVCHLQTAGLDSATVDLTEVITWLETHQNSLSPPVSGVLQQVSPHVLEHLTTTPDLQSRWQMCFGNQP